MGRRGGRRRRRVRGAEDAAESTEHRYLDRLARVIIGEPKDDGLHLGEALATR